MHSTYFIPIPLSVFHYGIIGSWTVPSNQPIVTDPFVSTEVTTTTDDWTEYLHYTCAQLFERSHNQKMSGWPLDISWFQSDYFY